MSRWPYSLKFLSVFWMSIACLSGCNAHEMEKSAIDRLNVGWHPRARQLVLRGEKIDRVEQWITDDDVADIPRLYPETETLIVGGVHWRVTSKGVDALAQLDNLRTLTIIPHINDAEWILPLSDLHELEGLAIGGAGVDDTCVEALLKMKSLRSLSLSNTAVTDDGLQLLNTLPALSGVSILNGPQELSKEGIASLSKSPKLERLFVMPVPKGASSFVRAFASPDSLAKLKTLKLSLSEPLGEENIHAISKIRSLEKLILWGGRIRKADLAILSDLDSLNELLLIGTAPLVVDTETAELLLKFKSLKNLKIDGYPSTPEAIAKLRKASSLESVQVDE